MSISPEGEELEICFGFRVRFCLASDQQAAEHYHRNGRRQRLGKVRFSAGWPGRLQLHPPLLRDSGSGPGGFTSEEDALNRVCGPSDAVLPPFHWMSQVLVRVQVRVAAHLSNSRQKGRSCGKERGKEENAMDAGKRSL